ncbi:substrate-binding periplasmic protein [Pseudomonas weihenstephanensis]|uniref:substrate-binding periplasmic protein n=1 Tax=Pseudomonas weihenstephanensis TaxID=1608994 RepID=UPI00193C2C8B|nr:transporter substrate-binding domain-containing protein [Pseudomonas weihenstephanensis]MBM1189632.1 amino acid ABC transporter substrate-binding protein [Pseudomonas weihenstephanensis]
MRLILCALLLAVITGHAHSAALRVAVADSWAMPMIEVTDGQPTSGILYDLILSLARHLGQPAQFHVLARARVQSAMEHGEVDIRCFVAPAWVGHSARNYLWSEPLLEQRDVLVSTHKHLNPVNVQTLPQQSIGTVLSYTYPSLQPLFDAEKLHRDDARSQEQVLQMLIARRFDYAVSNQWALDWVNKSREQTDQLHSVALIQEQRLSCMVRNDPHLATGRILDTLVNMRDSGEIERIIARYTTPSAP